MSETTSCTVQNSQEGKCFGRTSETEHADAKKTCWSRPFQVWVRVNRNAWLLMVEMHMQQMISDDHMVDRRCNVFRAIKKY